MSDYITAGWLGSIGFEIDRDQTGTIYWQLGPIRLVTENLHPFVNDWEIPYSIRHKRDLLKLIEVLGVRKKPCEEVSLEREMYLAISGALDIADLWQPPADGVFCQFELEYEALAKMKQAFVTCRSKAEGEQ